MKKKMILKKTINKAILLFMMISVLLGVSGCSSDKKDDNIELSSYQEFGARKVDKIISSKIDSIVIDNILAGNNNISIKTLSV